MTKLTKEEIYIIRAAQRDVTRMHALGDIVYCPYGHEDRYDSVRAYREEVCTVCFKWAGMDVPDWKTAPASVHPCVEGSPTVVRKLFWRDPDNMRP